MSIIFGIFLTLIILTLVVFIHEIGHFMLARLSKMKVEEFGIGLPPLAKKFYRDRKGTDYTFNWLPIGGFVRIRGENPSSHDAHEKDSFSSKKWIWRVGVLIAGVGMNFLLAWIIFSLLLWKGSAPLAVNYLLPINYGSYFLPSLEEAIDTGFITHSGIEIEPLTGGPADKVGIQPGDRLLKIDNKDIGSIDDFIDFVKLNNPMEFTLIRKSDQSLYKVGIVPIEGKIKSYLRYSELNINMNYQKSFGFTDSLLGGGKETYILSKVTLDFLRKTIHDLFAPKNPVDREIAKEMVAGPIGMGASMVKLVDMGISFHMILLMIAFLSVNLGVLNILPFPALDGGRILSTTLLSFLSLFIKKGDTLKRIEQVFHSIGMIFLIGVSLLVAFHDILKI